MIEERLRFTTNALNRLGENIELLQYDNKFTDGAYTFYCATKCADFDRWSSEKINAIAALYGCELNDIELSKKATEGFEKAKIAMIQAITAIETYLYLVPEDEAYNEEKADTSMVEKVRKEKADLDEKIMKLKIFLNDDEKLSSIGTQQPSLMRAQLKIMEQYSSSLELRLCFLEG